MDNNSIKTYTDMLNDAELDEKSLKLFNEIYEKLNNLNKQELNYIAESLKNSDLCNVESINNDIDKAQNEGLIGGIVGGISGLVFGQKIGAAICKALGITTGPLYSLLNSKLVTTAICTYLGIKM